MGKVYLIGAGPGDPELLTVKAARLLEQATIVLHDSLVSREVLQIIPRSAEIIDVGKRCGQKLLTQDEINALLVSYAASREAVIRLKGGDPVVFGRAGEEIEALRRAGVAFEIVPGITAALGAAAVAGISLTDRRAASQIVITTYSRGSDSALADPDVYKRQDRFYNLVKHHFYDNASLFRVLPGFVAQFGISAYPAVNKVWEPAVIKDDPVTQSNLRGYLTFATGGPNTRTTQMFINLVDNKRLDSMGFAAFGQVTDGMKVVDMFYDQYGEGAPSGGGPDQDQIQKQGKPYLDKGWPKLDYIKTTTIISPTQTPPAKPAAGAKTSAPAAPKPQ